MVHARQGMETQTADTAAGANATASIAVLRAEQAYDRIADHAWSMAMAILDDAHAATEVLVDAFRTHPCADGRCEDLSILTSVVTRARTVAAAGRPAGA